MKLPKVSIITPSFNQAPFLEQCIRSVINQDYPNIEYIIIDGGSTDGSIDIIRKYEEKIAYWESETDYGQSHAINKGFKKATGEIVAWLNSDDIYFPDAVSSAIKQFQNQPELVLFYGNCVFVDKSGGFIRYFTEVEPYNKKRLLNFSDYIMQPTSFFKNDKLKEAGYLDETLHFTMDWDLWCKLCKIGKVHYENRLIAANRVYESTKTNSGGIPRLKEILKLQIRHITGIWPHAFWGYSAVEIRNKSLQNNNRIVKKMGIYFSSFVSYLAPTSVLFGLMNNLNKSLYGFKPYSLIIPDGKGEIHLPLTGFEAILELEFGFESKQQLVYINGILNKDTVFKLIIDSIMHEKKSLSIFLEFKTETGQYHKGKINKIKLIPMNPNGEIT